MTAHLLRRVPFVPWVLICLLFVVVIFAPMSGQTRAIDTLHDFAHAPIFGCVALLLLQALRAGQQSGSSGIIRQYVTALVVAVLLGALSELAQIPAGRDASWLDLRSDLLGAAGFLGVFAVIDPRLQRSRLRFFAGLAGIALLLLHSLSLLQASGAYVHRARIFPELATFGADRDLYFMSPQWADIAPANIPLPWASRAGEQAVHVRFYEGSWPGFHLAELSPDWTGCQRLVLDLINPTDQPLALEVRVNDIHHNNDYEDRFNRTFVVSPQSRSVVTIAIRDIEAAPRARPMDMRHIADMILFRSAGSTAGEMYVAALRLE